MAWAVKMRRKFAGEETFKVAPLEGIYKTCTEWTVVVEMPDYITAGEPD